MRYQIDFKTKYRDRFVKCVCKHCKSFVECSVNNFNNMVDMVDLVEDFYGCRYFGPINDSSFKISLVRCLQHNERVKLGV